MDNLLKETFENLSNYSDKNKVVIINSQKISFNSNLKDNQFIKHKENMEIEYSDGNLNLILPDSGKIKVSLDNVIANLSINCEGELILEQLNFQTKSLNITRNSQINGSVNIIVPNEINTLTIDSIELKENGSVKVQTENNEKHINYD